jgi:hypothetical protein
MDAQLRVERWPIILAEAIEDARLRPFAWGTHDCATWAFSVAAALRGQPVPAWVGTYDTKTAAGRRMREAGTTLRKLGTAILGEPLSSPLLAWRGDVVFASGAYGICIGRDIAQVGAEGLVLSPLTVAERAWRV